MHALVSSKTTTRLLEFIGVGGQLTDNKSCWPDVFLDLSMLVSLLILLEWCDSQPGTVRLANLLSVRLCLGRRERRTLYVGVSMRLSLLPWPRYRSIMLAVSYESDRVLNSRCCHRSSPYNTCQYCFDQVLRYPGTHSTPSQLTGNTWSMGWSCQRTWVVPTQNGEQLSTKSHCHSGTFPAGLHESYRVSSQL